MRTLRPSPSTKVPETRPTRSQNKKTPLPYTFPQPDPDGPANTKKVLKDGEIMRFNSIRLRPYSDFRDLYHKDCGFSRQQVADFLGVDRTTITRYERGLSRIPLSVWRCLELAAGHLGALHPAWKGWRIDPASGALTCPDLKDPMQPGDVAFAWFARQHVALHERALRATNPKKGTWLPTWRFRLVEEPEKSSGQ